MMKLEKSEVNYRRGNNYERCQLCRFFKKPTSCSRVVGKVFHTDICDLYVRVRDPFDYSPDEGETADGTSADD